MNKTFIMADLQLRDLIILIYLKVQLVSKNLATSLKLVHSSRTNMYRAEDKLK